MTQTRDRLFHAMLAGGAALGALAGGQGARAAEAPTRAQVEEVIVTAQKRAERLSDVPAAVTAVSADQMQSRGGLTVRDLALSVPGLQVAGGIGSGMVTLRGVTSGNDVNPTVGTQVDGVPVGAAAFGAAGAASLPELDPSLLNRVEVLRGPQGTLYGSSTLGGIVNYVTRRPSLVEASGSFYAEGALTRHGASSGTLRGLYSAPLATDRVGILASAFYNDLGGFIDAPASGRTNVNDRRSYGGSLAVLVQVAPQFQVELSELYSKIDSTQDLVVYDPVSHKPVAGDLNYPNAVLPRYDNRFNLVTLRAEYELPWATFSSITGYQTVKADNVVDFGASSLGAIATGYLPLYGGVTLPTPPNPAVRVDLDTEKFTQEFRLTSRGEGALSWIVGLFFNDEKSSNIQRFGSYGADDHPNAGAAGGLLRYDLLTHYKEYAAFANVSYAMTSRLTVTGGLRVQAIRQDYRQLYSGSDAAALNALYVDLGLAATPADSGLSKANDTVVTYLANARYEIAPGNMIYARFATGFRPGGPNIVVPGLPLTFKPDTTTDYEVGWKTTFWKGRGFLDLDAYDIEWKDLQIITFSHGINGQTNGGKARIQGIEANLSLEPVRGLKLSGSIAYSNGRLLETIPGGLGEKGDRMPATPRWSGTISADYEWTPVRGWTPFLGGSASFVGERDFGFAHNAVYASYTLPSYGLVNLRAGVRRGNLEVSGFIRNLTDERAQIGVTTLSGALVNVQRPRTVGVALSLRH